MEEGVDASRRPSGARPSRSSGSRAIVGVGSFNTLGKNWLIKGWYDGFAYHKVARAYQADTPSYRFVGYRRYD